MSELTPPVPEPAKPPKPGNWWQRKSRFKKILWSLGAVFALLIVIAIAVPADDDEDQAATPTSPAASEPETTEPDTTEPDTTEPEPSPPPSSSNKATDENEPHVGRNATVIVDTLTWRVLSVRQAQELGGEFSRETPDGVYVVVKARVTNGKDESVTINSDIAQLEVAGSSYDTDTDGTTALQFGDDEEVSS